MPKWQMLNDNNILDQATTFTLFDIHRTVTALAFGCWPTYQADNFPPSTLAIELETCLIELAESGIKQIPVGMAATGPNRTEPDRIKGFTCYSRPISNTDTFLTKHLLTRYM